MLYELSKSFVAVFSVLNVFKYITFRSVGALLTALLLSFLYGNSLIKLIAKYQAGGQPIRLDGPAIHLKNKKGTPTMGGIIIMLSLTLSVLLWIDLHNLYVWVVMFVTWSFAILGFLDDYLKIKYKSSKGLPGRYKFLVQGIVSVLAVYFISKINSSLATKLYVPFFKDFVWNLGIFYYVFAVCVITGSSNAVNLTDGLDGLATIPVILVLACFAIISHLAGNILFAEYLKIPYVANAGELTVFCAALIGASLGFLWYNCQPAQIFMGDIGSLALGGAIGIISVITKHEIVLAIVGGLFVIETVSVILQVLSFRLYGKRIFLMAPVHHHFEKKGWAESKVVVRFWILSIIFALLGLSTLKLR